MRSAAASARAAARKIFFISGPPSKRLVSGNAAILSRLGRRGRLRDEESIADLPRSLVARPGRARRSMSVFQGKFFVRTLRLSRLEIENVVLADEGALRVVAAGALVLRDLPHEADRDQARLLVLLVLEAHVLLLEEGSSRAVTHLAPDAGEVGRGRDVDEAAGLP